MALWTALGAAFSAAFALTTAGDVAHEVPHAVNDTPSWGFHLIPTLILTGAVLLSLEIFDHTRVSRPLAATALAALWGSALGEGLQVASLLAAVVYHGVPEAYSEWTRGFPCLFQQDAAARKLRLWLRFWLRVFVWATTLATATRLYQASQGMLGALQSALFVAVHCECTEIVLVLYFTDKTTATYNWRRRVLLWATSLWLGVLYATHTLAAWAIWVGQSVRPVVLGAGLLVAMAVAMSVEWPGVVTSTQRVVHSLVAFVSSKKKATTPTTTTRTGQRRSFLYRAGSDVEVVGVAMHYEAYDFRHKHVEEVGARSPA